MVCKRKHQYANSDTRCDLPNTYSLCNARVPESVDGSDLKSADL